MKRAWSLLLERARNERAGEKASHRLHEMSHKGEEPKKQRRRGKALKQENRLDLQGWEKAVV